MGEMVRARDWSATDLGAPEGWPQSLRTTLSVVLHSKTPMLLAWGAELTCFYNDACRPLLGAWHPEALGRPLSTVWGDIWPKLEALVGEAVSGEGNLLEGVPFLIRRDGIEETAFFTLSNSPVRDEGNIVRGILCVCTEAADCRPARRRSDSDNGPLLSMFEQAPGFMAVARGPDHVFEFANLAYRQFVGRHDLIGKTVRETLPEIAEQGFLDLLDQVRLTGKPCIGRGTPIVLQTAPDLAPVQRFMDFVYQPITASDGSVTGIFAQGHDVTEQVLTQKALRERDAILQGALRAGRSVTFEVDLKTGKATRSDAAAELLGLQAHSHDEFVHNICQEDRAGYQHMFRKAQTSGQPEQTEIRFVRPDGETLWLSVRMEAALSGLGAATSISGIITDVTERKHASAEIAFQASLLQSVEQAVIATTLDGEVTFCNRFAERLYGWPQEEALGRNVFDFFAISDPAISAAAMALLEQDGSWSGEFQAKRRDGSEFPAYVANSLICDAEGSPIGVVSISSDITAQKLAEAERHANEERYRALVTATSSVLWLAAADGSITKIAGLDGYEVSADDLLGTGWLSLAHPDDRERLSDEWKAIVSSGEPGESKFRYVARGEKYRWFRCHSAPLKNADGTVREWIGTLRDIDEVTKAEERLVLRDRSLAAIAQGVIIVDARLPDLPIVYANPAFERLTGYSSQEVSGRNCRFLQGARTDRRALSRIKAALTEGQTVHETLINYRKDGTEFSNDLMISPVRGPDGSITHFVGTQSDITEPQRSYGGFWVTGRSGGAL